MQKNNTLKRFLYKKSYLPVIAFLLITLSFIIDNYWSGNSSVNAVQKNVEEFIQNQEKDFLQLMTDTSLVSKIAKTNYDEDQLLYLTQKKYFIHIYIIYFQQSLFSSAQAF